MTDTTEATVEDRKRQIVSHVWARETNEHYVEPRWCSRRLFETIEFPLKHIHDPCCGFGSIPESAKGAGLAVSWSDLVDRGYPGSGVTDFLQDTATYSNIVSNPPFKYFQAFAERALKYTTQKVAMLWGVSRLPAAHWLKDTPLRHVLLLTPRPSMPPGHVLAAGGKAQGGKVDYCWLVWDHAWRGRGAEMRWLHRDGQ